MLQAKGKEALDSLVKDKEASICNIKQAVRQP